MATLLDDMVEARLGWTSDVIRSWYPEADLRRQLRAALTTEASWTGDVTFGREYREGVGLDAPVDPLDWANRRIELPDSGWAVTGIRFRARDVTRPFVDVIATTAAATVDGLALVVEAVAPAYDAFAPLCFRVDAPDPAALLDRLGRDSRFGHASAVDMHVVAGQVAEIRTHPRTPSYERVSLRAGDPAPLAERVSAIYAELAEREPELATWAAPEGLDSLTQCAEEGLLFEVLADGSPAGVVASVRDDAHGMAGFSMEEVCLDLAHRGQHLAAPTVQRLVDELPARPRDVLWGTIHPANAPSLRNALSVGRVQVGGYVWVTPAGWPGMPASAIR